jgi:hypothetical protein
MIEHGMEEEEDKVTQPDDGEPAGFSLLASVPNGHN